MANNWLNAVFEVRTGGADTNGGGFISSAAGTDYSQQNAAQVAVTDAVTIASSAQVTSATAGFTSAWLGNIIYLSGGTGGLPTTNAAWYVVITVTNATTIVVDRLFSVNSTGCTLNMGGALLSPAIATSIAGLYVAGNNIHIKKPASGVYAITTATANIAGGVPSTAGNAVGVYGYSVTRYDGGQPTIQLQIGSASCFRINSLDYVQDLILDANSQTSSTCLTFATQKSSVAHCQFLNSTVNGVSMNNYCECIMCYGSGCSGTAVFNGNGDQNTDIFWSAAIGNTATSSFVGYANCVNCLAAGGVTGFVSNTGGLSNCTSYDNSQDGVSVNDGLSQQAYLSVINCISYANGRYGYNFQTATTQSTLAVINCYAGSNTSGNTNPSAPALAGATSITSLTANPFLSTTPGNPNFLALNSTAGGGALCQGGSFTFLGAGTSVATNYAGAVPPAGAVTVNVLGHRRGAYVLPALLHRSIRKCAIISPTTIISGRRNRRIY